MAVNERDERTVADYLGRRQPLAGWRVSALPTDEGGGAVTAPVTGAAASRGSGGSGGAGTGASGATDDAGALLGLAQQLLGGAGPTVGALSPEVVEQHQQIHADEQALDRSLSTIDRPSTNIDDLLPPDASMTLDPSQLGPPMTLDPSQFEPGMTLDPSQIDPPMTLDPSQTGRTMDDLLGGTFDYGDALGAEPLPYDPGGLDEFPVEGRTMDDLLGGTFNYEPPPVGVEPRDPGGLNEFDPPASPDASQDGTGLTLGGALGVAGGLGSIASALVGDQSDTQKALGVAGGAVGAYNAAATMLGAPTIPYAGPVLAGAQMVAGAAEADNPAAGTGTAVNAALNANPYTAIANFATQGKLVETAVHALEDLGLGHEPSHGERERGEAARLAPHANNLAFEASLATTPAELWEAISRTRADLPAIQHDVKSIEDLLADPESYSARVQAGVSRDFLDPLDRGITQAVQSRAWLLRAVQEGVPGAAEALERVRVDRKDFYGRARGVVEPTGAWTEDSEGMRSRGAGDPGYDPGLSALMDVLAGSGGGRQSLERYATSPHGPMAGSGAGVARGNALARLPAELHDLYSSRDIVPALFAGEIGSMIPNVPGGTATSEDWSGFDQAIAGGALGREIEAYRSRSLPGDDSLEIVGMNEDGTPITRRRGVDANDGMTG